MFYLISKTVFINLKHVTSCWVHRHEIHFRTSNSEHTKFMTSIEEAEVEFDRVYNML